MSSETFDYLWDQGIIRAANDVYASISDLEVSEFTVRLDSSSDAKEQVLGAYDEARQELRQRYFNEGANSENLIDGHKICACITEALLKIRLVRFDTSKANVPLDIVYSNYAIAFLAGIYVLYLFLLSDYKKEQNEVCYSLLKKQATFFFPKTHQGHDEYAQGRIKTLALNDYYGNDFDVLTYADMLFWIETYNRYLIESKIGK